VSFPESEAKKCERQADAVGAGGELLGEQHQPDGPEQIQRPADRPRDQEGSQRPLS
jgi:hypothetical protein